MRRKVVNSLVAGVVLAGNAFACQAGGQAGMPGLEQWQDNPGSGVVKDSRYPQAWQGAGIGAIAGAILAGPPGFIVGAAGGALAGTSAGLESDLHATRQELQRLERDQQLEAEQLTALAQQLASAKSAYRQQLDAIARGFVQRIYFRTGKNTLEPEDLRDLANLAEALRTFSQLRVVVHAHADRRGGAVVNRSLSAARAEAVSQQLILHGVPPERIARQAHGESDARYPADDREGLGYDRQVVIRLLSGAAS